MRCPSALYSGHIYTNMYICTSTSNGINLDDTCQRLLHDEKLVYPYTLRVDVFLEQLDSGVRVPIPRINGATGSQKLRTMSVRALAFSNTTFGLCTVSGLSCLVVRFIQAMAICSI